MSEASFQSGLAGSLDKPLRYLKGVGPRLSSLLEKRGLFTLEDLLFYFPNRYIDKRIITPIKDLFQGERVVIRVRFLSGNIKYLGRKRVYEWVACDESGTISLLWFYFKEKAMKDRFDLEKYYLVYGQVSLFRTRIQIIHPEIMEWNETGLSIEPVYPLTEGISQKKMKDIIGQALAYIDLVEESPLSVRQEGTEKVNLRQSLSIIHQPPAECDVVQLNDARTIWHQRVFYEELFYLQLGLALKKLGREHEQGFVIPASKRLLGQTLTELPFQLTNDQKKVLDEIRDDFQQGSPMNRLLQGDVGSGKTIVAFLSALSAIESGYQVALMAPTEILAEQHYQKLLPLAKMLGLEMSLLMSATSKATRRQRLARLESGDIHLMIGTHALFSDDVIFKNLSFVIIDEQHRFGVMQRAKLKAKAAESNSGCQPHILAMTATPIPRTLSMTLHGDLSLSLMKEKPVGRKEIKTKVIYEPKREGALTFIMQQLAKGGQIYVVCPLIQESEKIDLKNAQDTAIELTEKLKPFKVGLLHGRMTSADKETIMGAFKSNELNVLVSTTVIEVGVDIPNASVMVVEHAERFGLSQLHQLRGRVGRGSDQSYCFLMAGYKQSEEAHQRLRIMEETNDGFLIAEEDLKIRGPGDFMGTRQSGLPEFKLVYLFREEKLLLAARRRAEEILNEDPSLGLPKHALIKKILNKRWQGRLNLSTIS